MNKTDLARFIDRWTIEYVRVYPHPVERVWRAVTDAAEIQAWFFGPASIDQRIGGAYALGGPDTVFKGTVTALQPPRLVRYAGPEPHGPQGYWQFELEEVAGGTRMVFIQRSQPGFWTNAHGWQADPPEHPAGELNPWRPGTLAGWHLHFDALGHLMAGESWERVKLEDSELVPIYRRHMLETQP